jgi:hypothetical protein
MLVTAYVGLGEYAAHDVEGSHQSLARGTSVGDQVTDPFVVDRVGPTHVEEALYPELDQQIPKVEGVEEVGVQKNDEWCGGGAVRGHAP